MTLSHFDEERQRLHWFWRQRVEGAGAQRQEGTWLKNWLAIA